MKMWELIAVLTVSLTSAILAIIKKDDSPVYVLLVAVFLLMFFISVR